jgi:glucuronate isomerase
VTVPFIHEDFLLETDTARRLYHEFAAGQPIIDYHCHLSPAQIAEDHRFRSLTELWLDGDHYKWRAMRSNGVAERLCTGDASDWERFEAWARTVPACLRNPLYHWTHLELAFPFGISDRLLDAGTARGIYAECNERLREPAFSARGLLQQFGVRVVCSTDDPTDDLSPHRAHRANGSPGLLLLPTFRPDLAMALEDLSAYRAWLMRLEQAADTTVRDYGSLLDALDRRHAFFHEVGCRQSDHGLETMYAGECSEERARLLFDKALRQQPLSAEEVEAFKSRLLHDLAVLDHGRGWVQQFHIGALRGANTRLTRRLGPNTGFDSIGDLPIARPLAAFLDRLDQTEQLARTILYNLNPRDNELFATMIGNFQDGSTPGKLQYGSAWWFLDQLDGMERQLNALSNMGLLSRFVGMLTDSRSFLSYSRHEYFRRLLCNMLGNDVRRGHLPSDLPLLGDLVRKIAHENARDYFRFE